MLEKLSTEESIASMLKELLSITTQDVDERRERNARFDRIQEQRLSHRVANMTVQDRNTELRRKLSELRREISLKLLIVTRRSSLLASTISLREVRRL